MKFEGQLLKMRTENAAPVQYYLNLSGDIINVNQLIGKKLSFRHLGYECVNCSRDQKIFRMGFCKKCFFESPYASDTIIRPELSTAHLGIQERDLEVEKEIQLAPHVVYLAYTGDVKVGVTREKQIPARWIDQGATFAMIIARTENRYEAGMIEVALKEHLPDKTNYKKMLQELSDDFEDDVDLQDFRDKIKSYFPSDYQNFYRESGDIIRIDFPYEAVGKITTVNLEKTPEFEGVLSGIKGQYLAFQDGKVLNIRGHEGFVTEISVATAEAPKIL